MRCLRAFLACQSLRIYKPDSINTTLEGYPVPNSHPRSNSKSPISSWHLTSATPLVLSHRVANFTKYLPEACFAWIGERGGGDPYCYRIHSPEALMELDFHCGSK
jgi:hypothetical protein